MLWVTVGSLEEGEEEEDGRAGDHPIPQLPTVPQVGTRTCLSFHYCSHTSSPKERAVF
jgi:hypothetical protein